jgi:hypothetical protein
MATDTTPPFDEFLDTPITTTVLSAWTKEKDPKAGYGVKALCAMRDHKVGPPGRSPDRLASMLHWMTRRCAARPFS